MERMACFIVLLSALFVSSANFVEGNQDCSSCYQLDIGVAVGIITCDIFLTLFIAVSVYCFVSHKNSRACSHTQARCCGSTKTTTHQSSMKPKMIEVESPYQELYGVQSDIYNDLQQYRKGSHPE
ncbi:TYRO protein tyrosine kinase-binding protein isoform X1 [Paramisgurnus dabryanus]|uniref:TYRO protein tyrosine kinase-binding protein isoform X1 n=1 Tax=Paramisgurnus dabryanus TaxID=90735 RepID=UPI0031F3C682